MQEITSLLNECSSAFSQTEEFRILKTYRTRDNRLTFDERFAINKSIERAYAPVFELLRADAPTLTESDLFFCALTFQHIETVAIAECLTVTKDAIRMRKLRLREKLPNKWFDILFPEQKRNSSDSVTSQNCQPQTTPITLPSQSTKNAKVMKEKMSFGKAISTCFSKLFTFEGRARRSEYWYFFLFTSIISLTYMAFGMMFDSIIAPTLGENTDNVIKLTGPLINNTISVIVFLLGLSVTVRRLHDIECSGWLIIPLSVLPNLIAMLYNSYWPSANSLLKSGNITPEAFAGIAVTLVFILLFFIGILVVKLILFCKAGTEGPNQYGPDPIRVIEK
jgi:uncharacterized membrane protein YhaH (DUF805 family)